ncbi:hypothetical protein SAMN04515617_114145 [Collimonas sp. OK242]|jgi:hypothetical protein|uniref:hypothetical protein n=1 Tax=Collimonas sp. OK242 TaxID=1798195 RepID=UPI0008996330|nr:hypothetical protein [Collimonas sp. OK242]SDY45217.1 hypothetical protein SAMN04515617_114145 [Collimonas sp. OK242]
MTSDPAGGSIPNPWFIWPWWLSQIMASATRSPFAAGFLNEPILPNGTFAGVVINQNNSSDPQAERDIVSEQSYGRQLGRLMDAVAVLISERPAESKECAELKDLLELKEKIDKIKNKAARSRFERVKTDLARLKLNAPKEYQERIDELDALPPSV